MGRVFVVALTPSHCIHIKAIKSLRLKGASTECPFGESSALTKLSGATQLLMVTYSSGAAQSARLGCKKVLPLEYANGARVLPREKRHRIEVPLAQRDMPT